MNGHNRIHTLLLALALAMPALPAMARPGHGDFGGGGGFGLGFLKQLDLTSEQKTKLKEIRQGGKDQMKALRQAAKDSREALKTALAGTADDASLSKLFADSQSKHQAMIAQGFQQLLKVRAILTPEQRSKVKLLMDERRSHRGRKGPPGEGNDDDEE